MRVKAKRLGWNEKLTGVQLQDIDPYEEIDDDLEGELEEVDAPATDQMPAMKVTLVGGQEADPTTVEPVG